MFNSDGKFYEGVWTIERVDAVGDNQVLVSFKTGLFESEEKASDPTNRQPYKRNPSYGDSIQTVTLPTDSLPTVDEFNSDDRNKLYTTLTEELDFGEVEED